MNHYEAKQEARRERLEARAELAMKESNRRIHEATREGALPPMGEPIKIGHHSERRHRAAIARSDMNMRKGIEAHDKAKHYAHAADAVGTGGISSDDPDAVAKLKAELAEDEARQEAMKAENAAWRKAGNRGGRQKDGTWVDQPCPAYRLSNNSQNMARIRARIAQLEANATREHKEVERADGVKVVENVEANRMQLIFPGKPSEAIRSILKSGGFRWAPSEGAWQRQLNNASRYAATYALREIDEMTAT